MSQPPALIELNDVPGEDFASRWKVYLEAIYRHYIKTVAFGRLTFRGCRVNCQFRPETHGKHYAFWHMMQEAALGKAEEDRTIDLQRCRRVAWIAWVVENAGTDPGIRVFKQAPRGGETAWALWLHECNYVVILWERRDYFLLKTAYMVLPHGLKALQRDWEAFQKENG